MGKEDRGFASMDRIKQREIARMGGRAAHVKGTAHEWSSEEAREAGRKGGMASHPRKHQQETAHVAEDQRVERDKSRHRATSGLAVWFLIDQCNEEQLPPLRPAKVLLLDLTRLAWAAMALLRRMIRAGDFT